jgi:hypothetical protein
MYASGSPFRDRVLLSHNQWRKKNKLVKGRARGAERRGIIYIYIYMGFRSVTVTVTVTVTRGERQGWIYYEGMLNPLSTGHWRRSIFKENRMEIRSGH